MPDDEQFLNDDPLELGPPEGALDDLEDEMGDLDLVEGDELEGFSIEGMEEEGFEGDTY